MNAFSISRRRPFAHADLPAGDAERPYGAGLLGKLLGLQLSVAHLLYAVSAILLIYLVAFPLGAMFWQSLQTDAGELTLRNYVDFVQNDRLLRSTWNTVLVSLATAIGSILIATPLAFGVARTNMRGKGAVKLAVVMSFASPPFLTALAYIAIGGPNAGYINVILRDLFDLNMTRGPFDIFSLYGFVFLALPGTVALVFLTLLPACGNMDPALEEASRVAGAGPIETIWRISFPVLRAGLLAGGLLAFSIALAMFATPYLLGIEVLTVAIRSALLVTFSFSEAATLACISVALSMAVLYLYRRSIKLDARYQTISGRGYRPAELQLGASRHLLTALAWTYAILGAFLPYVLIFALSFMITPSLGPRLDNFTLDHYRFIFTDGMVRSALMNSLILGLLSATIIAGLGFLLAYIVSRTKMPGRAILDYLCILPVGIAGTAFAVGVIILNLETPLSAFGLYGSLWILLIAYVGRYIPFGMRTAQISLLQVSRELEEASRVAGGTQLRTLWHITLPLVRPGIVYAWILGMLQAFPEVSASVMLRGPDMDVAATMLLVLYGRQYGLPLSCALATLLFVIVMVLIFVAQRVGGRPIVPRLNQKDVPTPVTTNV
jgi:iron(III) transport system permease protein